MRDARIKELENKLKSVVRKKIDKIQITSMADFAYFLDVLIKGMKEFIEENYEENTDNMQFLLDELEKELDQWIEVN